MRMGRKEEIKEKVLELVNMYGTRNPYRLAGDMGYLVQEGNLGKVPGCCIKLEGQMVIFVNVTLERPMRTMVTAHELGHAVLHPDDYYFYSYTRYNRDRVEIEAHTFAAELLIPDKLIEDYQGYSIDQLAILTGYTTRLLGFKKYGYKTDKEKKAS